jgi:hypothetical protein
MADPTLKDVLQAVEALAKTTAELKADLKRTATKSDLAELRAELADVKGDLADVKGDLERLDAKVTKLDAKVTKGFADLDEELTRHAAVPREIEKDACV